MRALLTTLAERAASSHPLMILGALRITTGDLIAAPTSRMHRTMLSLLACSPNSMVSREAMIDALWCSPPKSYRANMRSYLTGVRRILELSGVDSSRLRSTPAGFLLHTRPGEVDIETFYKTVDAGRASVARGDVAEGAQSFATALELWTTPTINRDSASGPVSHQFTALEMDRVEVTEDLIDARLRLNDRTGMIAVVHRHAAEHPTRERAWAQLIRAHYLAGDVGGALDAYRRAREVLAGQLGVEPGRALQDLHCAVLRRDDDAVEAFTVHALAGRR